MSAFLLKYPKKPNELADDIESIIYVFTECLARFHRHSLSNLLPKGTTDLARWNMTQNDLFLEFYNIFFHQKYLWHGGYMVGGDEKMKVIMTRGIVSMRDEGG